MLTKFCQASEYAVSDSVKNEVCTCVPGLSSFHVNSKVENAYFAIRDRKLRSATIDKMDCHQIQDQEASILQAVCGK